MNSSTRIAQNTRSSLQEEDEVRDHSLFEFKEHVVVSSVYLVEGHGQLHSWYDVKSLLLLFFLSDDR